jgi:hypothetical protein
MKKLIILMVIAAFLIKCKVNDESINQFVNTLAIKHDIPFYIIVTIHDHKNDYLCPVSNSYLFEVFNQRYSSNYPRYEDFLSKIFNHSLVLVSSDFGSNKFWKLIRNKEITHEYKKYHFDYLINKYFNHQEKNLTLNELGQKNRDELILIMFRNKYLILSDDHPGELLFFNCCP